MFPSLLTASSLAVFAALSMISELAFFVVFNIYLTKTGSSAPIRGGGITRSSAVL